MGSCCPRPLQWLWSGPKCSKKNDFWYIWISRNSVPLMLMSWLLLLPNPLQHQQFFEEKESAEGFIIKLDMNTFSPLWVRLVGSTMGGFSKKGNKGDRLFDLSELRSVPSWGLVKPLDEDGECVGGRGETNGGWWKATLSPSWCLFPASHYNTGSVDAHRCFRQEWAISEFSRDLWVVSMFGSAQGEGCNPAVKHADLCCLTHSRCADFNKMNTTFNFFFSPGLMESWFLSSVFSGFHVCFLSLLACSDSYNAPIPKWFHFSFSSCFGQTTSIALPLWYQQNYFRAKSTDTAEEVGLQLIQTHRRCHFSSFSPWTYLEYEGQTHGTSIQLWLGSSEVDPGCLSADVDRGTPIMAIPSRRCLLLQRDGIHRQKGVGPRKKKDQPSFDHQSVSIDYTDVRWSFIWSLLCNKLALC